ncbi:MAG: DNA-binding domain-containing protein [Ignavibacteria bacterium]|jgi:hypothetical protein
MPIQYSLRENLLTPEPNDFMATVTPTRSVEMNDVIDRMIERGSTVTKADILSVMEDFKKVLEVFIEEGASVILPFAHYTASIKGIFEGHDDIFDSKRHQISININPGKDIKALLKKGISVEKQKTVIPSPNLTVFTDFNTGEKNSIVTPGGIAQILGHMLKFSSDIEEDGIYFVKEDGTETKVAVVGQNKPSVLMFLIPAELTSGECSLEVRTKVGENIRSGKLRNTLSVA